MTVSLLSLDNTTRGRGSTWSGRIFEFLVVGGLTPFLFFLSWLIRKRVSLDPAEYAVGFLMFYGAFVINDPHFAVTYLLFYKDMKARLWGGVFSGRQRLRYVLLGFLAPLLLGVWAIWGLVAKSTLVLGAFFQLMFLLVGWHYVKQGFGVFAVLAARRGVRFAPKERIAFLAHCYAGWAYAWASPFDPGREVEEKGVVYTTFAHPVWLERLTFLVFVATIVPVLGVLIQKWRRDKRLPIFTPLTALLCSIWPWSIYSSVDPLVRYMVPALHSIQYLYFVWLLKGNEARERQGPPWFERAAPVRLALLAFWACLLGLFLFHLAPSALDGALVGKAYVKKYEDMGVTPYFAALYAFVNMHHYLMDAVIWRRENPETRYLGVVGAIGSKTAADQ